MIRNDPSILSMGVWCAIGPDVFEPEGQERFDRGTFGGGELSGISRGFEVSQGFNGFCLCLGANLAELGLARNRVNTDGHPDPPSVSVAEDPAGSISSPTTLVLRHISIPGNKSRLLLGTITGSFELGSGNSSGNNCNLQLRTTTSPNGRGDGLI